MRIYTSGIDGVLYYAQQKVFINKIVKLYEHRKYLLVELLCGTIPHKKNCCAGKPCEKKYQNDGTAEPLSRETKFSGANEEKEINV